MWQKGHIKCGHPEGQESRKNFSLPQLYILRKRKGKEERFGKRELLSVSAGPNLHPEDCTGLNWESYARKISNKMDLIPMELKGDLSVREGSPETLGAVKSNCGHCKDVNGDIPQLWGWEVRGGSRINGPRMRGKGCPTMGKLGGENTKHERTGIMLWRCGAPSK